MSDNIGHPTQLHASSTIRSDDIIEAKVLLAVQAFEAGNHRSIAAAAKAYDAPYYRTLNRHQGHHRRKDNIGRNVVLNEPADLALHAALQRLILWGTHISSHRLWRGANDILKLSSEPGKPLLQVKHRWARRYLARHKHIFKKLKRKPQSLERRLANDYANLDAWFHAFRQCYIQNRISPEFLFNMDETGFRLGCISSVAVWTYCEISELRLIDPESRIPSTVVECVSADGKVLPSWIIIPAIQIPEKFGENDLDDDTVICPSENGWIDDMIALDWLDHFATHTKPRDPTQKRMLILDNHGSHETIEFEQKAREAGIIIFPLPEHTSHILQPLDVGIFQAYKAHSSYEMFLAVQNGAVNYAKDDFLAGLQAVRNKTFKKSTILGAWAKTGLVPFNPKVVLDKVTDPSSSIADLSFLQGKRGYVTPLACVPSVDIIENVVRGHLPERSDIFTQDMSLVQIDNDDVPLSSSPHISSSSTLHTPSNTSLSASIYPPTFTPPPRTNSTVPHHSFNPVVTISSPTDNTSHTTASRSSSLTPGSSHEPLVLPQTPSHTRFLSTSPAIELSTNNSDFAHMAEVPSMNVSYLWNAFNYLKTRCQAHDITRLPLTPTFLRTMTSFAHSAIAMSINGLKEKDEHSRLRDSILSRKKRREKTRVVGRHGPLSAGDIRLRTANDDGHRQARLATEAIRIRQRLQKQESTCVRSWVATVRKQLQAKTVICGTETAEYYKDLKNDTPMLKVHYKLQRDLRHTIKERNTEPADPSVNGFAIWMPLHPPDFHLLDEVITLQTANAVAGAQKRAATRREKRQQNDGRTDGSELFNRQGNEPDQDHSYREEDSEEESHCDIMGAGNESGDDFGRDNSSQSDGSDLPDIRELLDHQLFTV